MVYSLFTSSKIPSGCTLYYMPPFSILYIHLFDNKVESFSVFGEVVWKTMMMMGLMFISCIVRVCDGDTMMVCFG